MSVHQQIEREANMDKPFRYDEFEHQAPEHKEVRTGVILEAKTPHIIKHRDGSASIKQKLKVAYQQKVFWIERELLRCAASQVQLEYRLMTTAPSLADEIKAADRQLKENRKCGR